MNLCNLRTIFVSILRFIGACRFSEVINLEISVIILKETYTSIFTEKAKPKFTENFFGFIYQTCSHVFVH